jgi:hypothetical protein
MLPVFIGIGLGLGAIASILNEKKQREIEEARARSEEYKLRSALTFVTTLFIVTIAVGTVFIGLKSHFVSSIIVSFIIGLICGYFAYAGLLGGSIVSLVISAGMSAAASIFDLCALSYPVLGLINFSVAILFILFIVISVPHLIQLIVLTAVGTFLLNRFAGEGMPLLLLGYIAYAMSIIFIVTAIPITKTYPEFRYIFGPMLLVMLSGLTFFLLTVFFKIAYPAPVILLIVSAVYGTIITIIQAVAGCYDSYWWNNPYIAECIKYGNGI